MTALVLHSLANSTAFFADKVPADKDVKAGWGAFFLFLGLIAAVALLGWSLVRQLRKAKAAADAGVYGPEDVERRDDDGEDTPA